MVVSPSVFAQHGFSHHMEYHPVGGMLRTAHCRPAWSTSLKFEIEDFTIDPGQDLLVALEPGYDI
jgi:hypothetical protein